MLHKVAVLALALAFAAPGLVLAATPVNVNTADAAVIARSLDGIGQAKAQAIVAWRDAHGPFKKADDLGHVKGIGKATIARNRAAIVLDDKEAAGAEKADAALSPSSRNRKAAARAALGT